MKNQTSKIPTKESIPECPECKSTDITTEDYIQCNNCGFDNIESLPENRDEMEDNEPRF